MSDESTVNETNLQEVIDITPGGKKNVILDATVMSTLMGCPRLTDFRFNHNLISIDGKSNSLECGSIVHKFLEVYYGSIINGIKKTDAVGYGFSAAQLYISGCKQCTDFVPFHNHPVNTMIDRAGFTVSGLHIACSENCITKPICGHKVNEYPGVVNTPPEPDKNNPQDKYKIGWKWVLDTCQQYIDFYRNDHWTPLEVEIVKGKVLYEDDEIRILWKVKLDLISDTNQGIFPIDHKTMKQNRNTTAMNNQFKGQCLIMETRKVFINKIGFQTTLKPEEKFKRPPMNYSGPILLEWQSETLPYYAKLLLMYAESGHFPPNYDHCEGKYGNCAFEKEVCTADPGMRNEKIKQFFVVGPAWNPTNDDED